MVNEYEPESCTFSINIDLLLFFQNGTNIILFQTQNLRK